MASYTIAAGGRAAHNKTLVAATVDTVTFTDDVDEIDIINLDGVAAIYYTVDGSTPTVEGANTRVLPSGTLSADRVSARGFSAPVVKLISAGIPKYSVEGV